MSLMRRLPPMTTIKNLAAICELIADDDVRDDVMIKSDQPLRKCPQSQLSHLPFLFQSSQWTRTRAGNIFNANIIKMVTHTGALGQTRTIHQWKRRTIQTTSQFILLPTCLKWKAKPMTCSSDTASCITIQTSTPPSTFLIRTLQMVSAAAG